MLKIRAQGELNQSRSIGLARNHPELRIVQAAATPIGRSKLDPVEQVEELRTKLQVNLFGNRYFLEGSEIPIRNPCRTQLRIQASLVAQRERIGLGNRIVIEPLVPPLL